MRGDNEQAGSISSGVTDTRINRTSFHTIHVNTIIGYNRRRALEGGICACGDSSCHNHLDKNFKSSPSANVPVPLKTAAP